MWSCEHRALNNHRLLGGSWDLETAITGLATLLVVLLTGRMCFSLSGHHIHIYIYTQTFTCIRYPTSKQDLSRIATPVRSVVMKSHEPPSTSPGPGQP